MKSDKSLRDLLSSLSHDIQGSLGGVDALNLIISDEQRSQLDESTQRRLALIHNEYVTTNRKLKALSEYASLFDHNEKLSRCSLLDIAQRGLHIAMAKAVEHGLSPALDVIGMQELPTIDGFELFWLHYFTELFYNSIQHAHPENDIRRARITVEHDDEANQHHIIYTDNARTTSDKDINYVMRPFKTLQTNIDIPLHGAGLGIYKLTRIVQLHGGTLQLKASGDEDFTGLRFMASVPVVMVN